MPESLPAAANAAVFGAAALAVWIAGWRIARYADRIEARTGIGEAWLGMLLLGGVSGLPELAVTLTASFEGHAILAVNNVVGSAATNLAVLGAADAAVRRETLSVSIATPTPLLQAALMIVMLGTIAASTLAPGHVPLLGVGAWSWAILALYLLSLVWIRNTRGKAAWRPDRPGRPAKQPPNDDGGAEGSIRSLWGRTALAAAVILVAGYALAQSGAALAEQTGLGESFFGAVFMAFATSLSDISIVFSAVRLGRHEMAIGDLFGSALFTLALVFPIDAVYRGEPVLGAADSSTTFFAILAAAMAALFVAGAVERRGARIGRMGVDSLALLGTYAVGISVLYRMR